MKDKALSRVSMSMAYVRHDGFSLVKRTDVGGHMIRTLLLPILFLESLVSWWVQHQRFYYPSPKDNHRSDLNDDDHTRTEGGRGVWGV